ncbi:N-acetyltransferase domain-containing protein [Caenorhabditis elegans]|uniref:N-acetyltransferase domain-containing protein n=1 Tax=Caenorhabditis elegans TaxID=6239 RepID=O46010_CAEEL|nr:N-acetyltransferase domain-containing protein [Caenorhabditis elegans]CAB04996.1 N-acetyltransferase domain-containing protein [Caenorhabditis elegans]|eukprot:NP_507615.1 Uncharacterized protein CELE_ZK228.4 [Caenorhabditis elegans]
MELVINPPQQVFDQLIDLAAETNGWAHQAYDYRFYSTKEFNNLVAGVSLARWDAKNDGPLYSIGLYYCKEEYRGKGYGKQVFDAIMDIVGDDTCALFSAVNMSKKYSEVFGFDNLSPYWIMEAKIDPSKFKIPKNLDSDVIVKDWKEVDEAQLEAYDLTICSRNRKKIMRNWFQQDEVYTRVAIDSNQKIVGYCTIRVVNLNRIRASPFYAENGEIAAKLLAETVKIIPNFEKFDQLKFYYPSVNKEMESLLPKFLPADGYTVKENNRVQFTKNFIKSRDEAVYSVSCTTHQYI